MYSHVTIGTKDKVRAKAFYTPIMEILGNPLRDPAKAAPFVMWTAPDGGRPFFVLATPFDGQAPTFGNGQMTALLAPSREIVDQVYAAAMKGGAADEGAPGLRPQYHENFYGAYFRDLDDNKICIVCHDAVSD
ncbi:VOC family protein [Henriciella aquimarina]|uniref:VOC family protein n=1 Tax=Henriciella aquimarina TaxID=545261 RepID=UPI000A072402|nr:VOC family protein [Henriciella aquimarina]